MSKSAKRGRPPVENPKIASLHLRITDGQKKALYRLASEKKMSVTELIQTTFKIEDK